jgi:hypothetical protein
MHESECEIVNDIVFVTLLIPENSARLFEAEIKGPYPSLEADGGAGGIRKVFSLSLQGANFLSGLWRKFSELSFFFELQTRRNIHPVPNWRPSLRVASHFRLSQLSN